MKRKSLFVTFEGIDGCGKSTHLDLAARYLRNFTYSVTVVREPGSTAVAERIREILLDRRSTMTAVTELMLYVAARADLTAAKIGPALKAGRIVLCDRFYDSTTAYQGYGRRLDPKIVRQLNSVAVGAIRPDLTLLLDVDLKTAFARRGTELDRLECESIAFFRRVRAGFLKIARQDPRRVKIIDSSGPIEDVFAEVKVHLRRKLSLA